MKLLVVVDMQNDFVTGALRTPEAIMIVQNVKEKIERYLKNLDDVIFTRNTRSSIYMDTNEGRHLPFPHCIKGTNGWKIIDELKPYAKKIIDKPTFGSVELAELLVKSDIRDIELVGLFTDICVVSNALLIKAFLPEANVSVDASCCAGITIATHDAALQTMKMCQIDIRE